MRIFTFLSMLFVAVSVMAAEPAPKVGVDEVVLKVNGIVCPACAYGIQKKVAKLSFVDTSRLHDGVELDVENHLAKIAIKKGQQPDFSALFAAVKSGGFDPVGGYILVSGKTVYTPATKE